MSVGRNEPCPCGSGKKYKHCHERTGGIAHRRARTLLLALAALALVIGVVIGIFTGPRNGALSAACGLVIAGVVASIADRPPPSGGHKDPGSINFGR